MRMLILILLSILLFNEAEAQNSKFIEKYKISTWFGVRDISNNKFSTNQNLDFLNYLYVDREYSQIEYEYLGFATQLWFADKWEADLRFTVNSSFAPSSFDVKAMYFPKKYFGVSLGLFAYPQYLNKYNTYHAEVENGNLEDIDSNYRQKELYDTGLSAGIVLPINYKFIHINLQLNSGISSFKTFNEKILLKEQNSNFKKEIQYKTNNSYSLFIKPQLEIDLDCIKFKTTTLGIQMQTSWYSAHKNINYERTTYNWTYDSPKIENITNPKHSFSKFELDFGLYCKW